MEFLLSCVRCVSGIQYQHWIVCTVNEHKHTGNTTFYTQLEKNTTIIGDGDQPSWIFQDSPLRACPEINSVLGLFLI